MIGAVFQGIGAVLKAMVNLNFGYLIAGQILWGIASPFFMCTIALVPRKWFEDSKRITAINIWWGFNAIGTGIGYIIPYLVVNQDVFGSEPNKHEIL